eukprot:12336820-Karenia_brevis.AAC.1
MRNERVADIVDHLHCNLPRPPPRATMCAALAGHLVADDVPIAAWHPGGGPIVVRVMHISRCSGRRWITT